MLNAILTSLHTAAAVLAPSVDLPVVTVDTDNTRITASCRVVIPPGTVIPDGDGDGVIHIAADGITVEFAPDAVLDGAPGDAAPETFTGIGIRLDGHRNVVLRNARVRGFKAGIHATRADGLIVEGADLSANFRQRLRSLPSLESEDDWLWPHANDNNEWLTRYGAAAYIEDSSGVVVRGVKVRRGQNGIVLDRVSASSIYDNDCSFLSGWGIAMWRSSGNTVSRNAVDFCVRGHSEGVYNRGQDSAGILMFEQCSKNVIAENSATHCGDGLFGFAGKEAIGEVEPPAGATFDYSRAGCNDNIIIGNDFSDSSAHGLEMTFSHGNIVLRNRFVRNAICGIWGGYSQEMLIAENHFEGNGGMAYGAERGGVNIEHGWGNRIIGNTFVNDATAVRLWWDDDKELLERPGVKTPYRGVANNVIQANKFDYNDAYPASIPMTDRPPVVLRMSDAGSGKVKDNVYIGNTVSIDLPGAAEFDVAPGCEPKSEGQADGYVAPTITVLGSTKPVGAREAFSGRQAIHMGPYGPWDHESPMVRLAARGPMGVVYEMFGGEDWSITSSARDLDSDTLPGIWPNSRRYLIRSTGGIHPYKLEFRIGSFQEAVSGVIVSITWQATFFGWKTDPRENIEGWRGEAKDGVTVPSLGLEFEFGGEGPGVLFSGEMRNANPAAAELPKDRFGVIARTSVPFPPGKWRITTRSDDGIRVKVGGKVVIDDWTWHAPKKHTAEFDVPTPPLMLRPEQEGAPGTAASVPEIPIEVEYFELDGNATLRVEIEPVR